jgi:hypothetical protein
MSYLKNYQLLQNPVKVQIQLKNICSLSTNLNRGVQITTGQVSLLALAITTV